MSGRRGRGSRAREGSGSAFVALPLLPAHLPEPAAQLFLELLEGQDAVGEREVRRPSDCATAACERSGRKCRQSSRGRYLPAQADAVDTDELG